MIVDLPRWTLADRVSCSLAVAAGIALEAVAAGLDAAPGGIGCVIAGGLLLWQRRNVARRPQRLAIGPGDGSPAKEPAGYEPCAVHAASRILGGSVVLHWRARSGQRHGLWLTPLDLPRQTLRRLAVRLVTSRPMVP
jgi:hypothetical protein